MEGPPISERVRELLKHWAAAADQNDGQKLRELILVCKGLTEEAGSLKELCNQIEPVLHLLIQALQKFAGEEDGIKQQEYTMAALSNVLAALSHDQRTGRLSSHSKVGLSSPAAMSQGAAGVMFQNTQELMPHLLDLLGKGSWEAKRRAAWCLHFIAVCHTQGALRWTPQQRTAAADTLIALMGSHYADAKVAACHAVSMCMQKDPTFRSNVAQANGVPLLIRLLGDVDGMVVAAAAGALSAIVHKVAAYAKWVVELEGAASLMNVLSRLPVGPVQHRYALMQVLWTLESMAQCHAAAAKMLIDEGLLDKLLGVMIACQQHGDMELEGAAAVCLTALVAGDDDKPLREKLMEQVEGYLGPATLKDMSERGGGELRRVAGILLQHTEAREAVAAAAGTGAGTAAGAGAGAAPHSPQPQPPQQGKPTPGGRASIAAVAAAVNGGSSVPTLPSVSGAQPAGAGPGPGPGAGPPVVASARPSLLAGGFVSRYALVVGVSEYVNLPGVKNGTRDAKDLGDALTKCGFKVTLMLDPDSLNLKSTFVQFEQKLMQGCLALIYFVGHGVCCGTTRRSRYLLPKDFSLAAPSGPVPPMSLGLGSLGEEEEEGEPVQLTPMELKVVNQAPDLDRLLKRLAAKGVRHIITMLDACRRCEDPSTAPPPAPASPTRLPPPSPTGGQSPSSPNEKHPFMEKKPSPSHHPSPPTSRPKPGAGGKKKKNGYMELDVFTRLANNVQVTVAKDGAEPLDAAARMKRQSAPSGDSPYLSKDKLPPLGGPRLARGSEPPPPGPPKEFVPPPAKALSYLVSQPGVSAWSTEGLAASLVVMACTPGSQCIRAADKGSRNSMFVSHLLRFCFVKQVTLRQSLNMCIKLVTEATKGAQKPGYADDGNLPQDFRFAYADG